MAHLDPNDDKGGTMGWLDGKVVFRSQNLLGLIKYGRKHGITSCELGLCISGDGLYTVTFGNGAVSTGTFASPSVMLGFFLNRTFVEAMNVDRTVFNKGACLGRLSILRHTELGRDGSMRVGPWLATAYRDTTQTPMVSFTRVA